MQISRHLLLTCAVTACLIPSLAHAADNEAQIRARQALEEKMNQLNAQPPPAAAPANPAPTVSKQNAPAKPAPPVVTVTPNGATVSNPPTASAADAATRQKLKDALNQAATPPAQPPVSAAPMQSQPATSAPSYISTPSNDAATSQKLEEALRQKMQQTPVESTTPPMATQKPTKPAPAWTPSASAPSSTANYAPIPETNPRAVRPTLPETPTPAPVMNGNQPAAPTIALPTLSGPPTGLSAAKEQKLNELLTQYRQDLITPQQYHEQRAKILAEP